MKKSIVLLCSLVVFVDGYVYEECILGNCQNGYGTLTDFITKTLKGMRSAE
jgi:hypothetical protein